MKAILSPFKLMALFFLLCSYTNSYPEPLSIKNSPIAEVAHLVEKLVMADSRQSTEILLKINSIRKKHPENTDILLMYINSLIGEKHYKEGINFLKILYEKKPIRTYLLTQCMLTQRLGGKERGCYEDVVHLSEKQNLIDSDYVTALFFTDTKKFNTVKHQLIKENKFKESDFLIFTLGKEKMLHEFFP
ncbi:hypothetical protein HH682_09730 [Rosenbergiella sp. S61]|uniref:Tetratricopeptide repeat protein n=1 Tax=Rosenbergiella gaditana TaxID=2726987 RepID=A0ABS5SXE7_9GAMM|nr:hypothetical protein [Rosenbergiella gaditana]MBT0724709.1 hypothetical protein [Rosenbergiella gaditana]